MVFCQLFYLCNRHADMIQPFHRDLFACTFLHWLFDIVARLIGEQAIDPGNDLIGLLHSEMWLAAYCPAHEPGRILGGDGTAGNDLPIVWVTAGQLGNICGYFFINAGNCGGFPVRTSNISIEFLWIAKRSILSRNILPQFPCRANAVRDNGHVVLIPVCRIFGI